MRSLSRALVALAVLLIGVAYVRPLWHIGLEAPQYPEGLGMYIWADKITGSSIPTAGYFGQPTHSYTVREPVGVIGMIVPWNTPLMIAAALTLPSVALSETHIGGNLEILAEILAIRGQREGGFLKDAKKRIHVEVE